MIKKDYIMFVVDDDEAFGDSLKFLFQSRGYTTAVFRSARAFLDSVPAGQKGIAVIDIHMPGIDGFELMDKMRELHYKMPVILVTGHTQDSTRDLAFKRGAVGFLQKPFSDSSLMDLIEEQESTGVADRGAPATAARDRRRT